MNNNSIDKKKLMDAIVASSGGKIDSEKLNGAVSSNNMSALVNSLSAEDKKKLNALLSDKSSLEAALKTQEAKKLLSMFLKGGGKNG